MIYNNSPDTEPKHKYKSRKFGLAVFFALTSTMALFTNYLGGGEYIGLVGLILGLYSGSNVMDKRGE